MKTIIITTFVLGLSTSAFANGEDLDKLYSFGAEDVQTSGAQPQVGNSRDSGSMIMTDDSDSFNWYDGNS